MKKKNIRVFYFQFLEVKFSIYLNRLFFVMEVRRDMIDNTKQHE